MNLEDYDNAMMQALDMENEGLFAQGDTIIAGIEDGLNRETAYGHFCYLARRSVRTAKLRHKTSAIFDESRRNPSLNWSFHSLCASAADLRKPKTWDKAYQWLDRAAGLIANDREYSVDDLANDMKATGLDPDADKPLYIADKDIAVITGAHVPTRTLTLQFQNEELFGHITGGMIWDASEVIVTIVQKVQTYALETEGMTE